MQSDLDLFPEVGLFRSPPDYLIELFLAPDIAVYLGPQSNIVIDREMRLNAKGLLSINS